jgi:signal transduction histidine kinase
MASQAEAEIARRAEEYASESDMGWVVQTLVEHRADILDRWLVDTSVQPFHRDRRPSAVADHIPALFDALICVLQDAAPRWKTPGAPLEDERVRDAAESHALERAAQGLRPADVIVEFRLLRQELLRAIRRGIPDDAPASDIVGTELVLNDCLDGASALALAALAKHVEREREEFLATIVHETRQPLTLIGGNLQLAERALHRDEPDIARATRNLRGANAATARLRAMIDTLVDSSRVALGGLQLRQDTNDLRMVLDQAVRHMDEDAAGRVRVEAAADLDATGWWDADRLVQVVSNLLTNAVKYDPGASPITVLLAGDATTLTLQVRDRGLGIRQEELPRLFKRYSRTSNVADAQIEGLGLGLYLCRGIVEAHGGRIWAESPGVGQGSTFTVELPRALPEAEGGADGACPSP